MTSPKKQIKKVGNGDPAIPKRTIDDHKRKENCGQGPPLKNKHGQGCSKKDENQYCAIHN